MTNDLQIPHQKTAEFCRHYQIRKLSLFGSVTLSLVLGRLVPASGDSLVLQDGYEVRHRAPACTGRFRRGMVGGRALKVRKAAWSAAA
jgi:hypothetical protein